MHSDLNLPPCNRIDRSHEGCGEERESSDVVWLRLRLDDQLDASSLLKRLGEVALLAEGDDVVVKGLVQKVSWASPKSFSPELPDSSV